MKITWIDKEDINAIEFALWLKNIDNGTHHYNPTTKEKTNSIGFSPFDCFVDDIYTIDELYIKFLNSKVNK